MRDIREILLTARGDMPPRRHSVDDVVAAGRRRKRRAFAVRLGGSGMVAAAVATVGVLVSVNLTVAGNQRSVTALLPVVVPSSSSPPAPSPPFTFTFGRYKVDNYRVLAPDEVTPDHQKAGILRDVTDAKGKVTTEYAGTMTVYQPRRFDPAGFRTGTKLTVQGRDAYHIEVARKPLDGWNPERPKGVGKDSAPEIVVGAGLAWQYAPDAWAVLEPQLAADGPGFPGADQVEIAERFTVLADGPVSAKVPFRPRYLPAGFTLQGISGQSMTAENRGMTTLVYAKPQPPGALLTAPRELEYDRTVTSVLISVLWVDTPPPDAVKQTSRCDAGRHWCMKRLPGNEFYLVVEDPSKTLPERELLKVVDSLTLADLKKAGTWFPAA
ncbi:hypothetical protein ACTMTJ_42690 [Phytohabitans sp. LJ34]|uniref:hypothetical protein n=1 Tax=Phytohabitans sp. LJ34 TaxID=3452217 RepID=UPI003F8BE306